MGCHCLLHGIILTQGSNCHLLHLQADSLPSELPRKPSKTSSDLDPGNYLPTLHSTWWVCFLTSYSLFNLLSSASFPGRVLKVFHLRAAVASGDLFQVSSYLSSLQQMMLLFTLFLKPSLTLEIFLLFPSTSLLSLHVGGTSDSWTTFLPILPPHLYNLTHVHISNSYS